MSWLSVVSETCIGLNNSSVAEKSAWKSYNMEYDQNVCMLNA